MRNWNLISDGDDFESLVGSLLMAEIPGVVVFGRLGPDSGVDSISADRTHVYQAKFHADGLMSSAIVSARKELQKIKSYCDPAHPNYKYWKDVTEWSLVGNFKINPADEEKWREQVEPEFMTLGLSAHFICEEMLDQWLRENPEIDHSFFGGHQRTLIYPAEEYKRLWRQSSNGSFFASEMIGRESSLAEVLDFAESHSERVLSIVGPYCSGKTRFLYESMVALSKTGWRVFWGLSDSLRRSNAWFDSIQSSKKTCIFLDDPKDTAIVGSMIEQLSAAEHANWKLVFTCSCERARILAPEHTTDAQFRTLKLPLLSREDIAKIVVSYPELQGRSPSVDGVADLSKGMPSLACLILEFYRQNKQLALPPDSLDLMDLHIERSLEMFDSGLKRKASCVLRWVSAWDGISLWDEDESNRHLQYLSTLGVSYDETREVLKCMTETGLVDSWKTYGRQCYRVQPSLLSRHILGSWLLEKDGGAYRVGAEGRKLIQKLLSGDVPDADKIFLNLPAVTVAYLHAEEEAEHLFGPVFSYLHDLAKTEDVETQSSIIGMLRKIGCFAPESTLVLMRSVYSNLRTNGRSVEYGDAVQSMVQTLADVAEYVRDRPLAAKYVDFFKEIYEATPEEHRRSNNTREELGKSIVTVINHFGELRHFPDIALSRVIERMKAGCISGHPFELMLATRMLDAERQCAEMFSSRMVTFCRRAILNESHEWNRAITIRENIADALKHAKDSQEREALWRLYRCGYQFAHNLCSGFVNHHHLATTEAARALLVSDLMFLRESLNDESCVRSIRELQLMRLVWDWECEYGDPSPIKDLALACEGLFADKLGFPFQHLLCQYSKLHGKCVKEVADLFKRAKTADEIDTFVSRVAEYFRADNEGSVKGVSGYVLCEIAALCMDGYDLDGADPISQFTLRCLKRLDEEHPLSAGFATTMVRSLIRKQKAALSHDAFTALFGRILSVTKDRDLLLRGIYYCGEESFFGRRTIVELDHLVGSSMAPIDIARVLPSWIELDQEKVLARLSSALADAQVSGNDSHAVLVTIVNSLQWASQLRKQIDESQIPLEWIVEKFNDGFAGASLLTEYAFVELCKLKNQKLGMRSFRKFVEAWIARERAGVHEHVDEDRFAPQDMFVVDDAEAFDCVCDLIFVGDSWFVSMLLGRIISLVDSTGEYTFNYVANYIRTHSQLDRNVLSGLARLVAYRQADEITKAVMTMICDPCLRLNKEDRTFVYYHMLPNEHGATWCGDTIPDRYLDAQRAAQALYESEPVESSLKEFYKYCVGRALGTVDMIRNSIEAWRHE